MKDDADQERVAGLFPMGAAFERSFGVDQDIGDILDVADLGRSFANFEQRSSSGPPRANRSG